MIALACVLLVLAPPMAALAHLSQSTYASGTNGAGGTYQSSWNHHDYNQVWHQAGREWGVWYYHSDGSYTGIRINTSNPTKWEYETSYARSQCHNYDDMSGVTWTCQTTG